MKSWPIILGGLAACAACCAVPVAASLAGGASLLAAGSALVACAQDFEPLAAVLAGVGVAVAATRWWRRRARRPAACGPTCKGCGDVRRA